MAVKSGLGIFTGQVPAGSGMSFADDYEDTLALASLAERVGFDSFWFSEHHGASDGYLPSLPIMMAAVAAVTNRMKIGTGILLAPFQHPLRFAEDCAVIDQLSRGRLMLGLGNGWRESEFTAFGIPLEERFGRTRELIEVCRSAWSTESFSFHGRYHQFTDASVVPKPYTKIPILLGGHADSALARAGRIADGYIAAPRSSQGVLNSVTSLVEKVNVVDEAARLANRDPFDLDLVFCTNVWVSEEDRIPPSVLQAMWYRFCTATILRDPLGTTSTLPPVDENLLRERALIGTPGRVTDLIQTWVSAFPGRKLHLVFRLHYPGMARSDAEAAVELFGSAVLPAIRQM